MTRHIVLTLFVGIVCSTVSARDPIAAPRPAVGKKAKSPTEAAVEKQRAEAKRQAEEARKRAEEAAKARQAALFRGYAMSGYAVRKEVDRDDPIERFLLLVPGGPLLVEVSLTIDGKPFRHFREKMVDDMLAAVDANKDGKPTWEEAFKVPRFAFGQLQVFANQAQREQYLKAFDRNGDGLMDRYEARLMIAQRSQGGDFMLVSSPNYAGMTGGGVAVFSVNGRLTQGGGADLKSLLDTDQDGTLSEKEIAAAADRLKSRDADDNDVLEPSELGAGNTATRRLATPVARTAAPQPAALAVLLGPTAEAGAVLNALKQAYAGKDGKLTPDDFPRALELFEQLDKDGDDELETNEVLTLNSLPPHLRMSVALGESGPTISVQAAAESLDKPAADASGRRVAATLPGVNLSFEMNPAGARTFDYKQTGKTLVARYDKNTNGYIDKDEMPGNQAQQFAYWDLNDDGKVYPEEIAATYDQQWKPLMTQVRANVVSQSNSLFDALDANGDSRLSLREMRSASQRIKTFDKNNDGRIAAEEIPITMKVTFGLGNAANNYVAQGGYGQPGRPAAGGPDWFVRMDRNGDGDITPREFLGTPEQFKKLDTNGDGFIERKEAEASGK